MDGGSFWISSYDGHTSRHRKVNGASAGRMLGINCGILRNLRGQLRIALVSTHVFSRISARTCSVSLRRPPHIRTELGLCAARNVATAPPMLCPYSTNGVPDSTGCFRSQSISVCASTLMPVSDGSPDDRPYPRYESITTLHPRRR